MSKFDSIGGNLDVEEDFEYIKDEVVDHPVINKNSSHKDNVDNKGDSESEKYDKFCSMLSNKKGNFDIENPFGPAIKDILSDAKEVLGVSPGTWFSAAALIFVVLPFLVLMYITFGIVEVIGQYFSHQIQRMKLRSEDPEISKTVRSGYLLTIGFLYILGVIPWTIALPFKAVVWIVDSDWAEPASH